MKEIRVYIERKPQYLHSNIYLYDDEAYYTLKDGLVVRHQREIGMMPSNDDHFLQIPDEILHALVKGFAQYAQDNNQLDSVASLSGKQERYLNEIGFLREIVLKQLK